MKAIRIHQYGGPEVLCYEETSVPEPGAGQVRLKIEATGLNFIDVYHRTGRYPGQLPLIPGMEGAGLVDALGPGVTEVKRGDRVVYAMERGSYAQQAIVPVWKLAPVPDDVEIRTAAAVILQGMTAHYLAHSTYPIQPGHTALVHAAAGGVGLLLVQVAKMRGARVIGTVSTEEKARLAMEAGADAIILYTQANFEDETKRLTDGQGVDVVYDSVGQSTFEKSLNCLKLRGYLVLYGASSGPVPPIDPLVLTAKGSLFLTRPSLGHYAANNQEILARMGDLFNWIRNGDLKVRIDQTYSLADAAEAHRYLEGRKSKGKVLLMP